MGLRSVLAKLVADRVMAGKRTRRAVMDRLAGDGIRFLKDAPDHTVAFFPSDVIGRQILETGEFSRQAVRDLRAHLEQNRCFRHGMTVLEIGANIGTQTVYFFRDLDCARVIALEPDPDNLRVLTHNMALNGLTDRVEPLALAASDRAGRAQFTRNLLNRGGSGLSEGTRRGTGSESFSVDVVGVDDLLRARGQDPETIDLVWMDVEGHELAALRGMTELMKTARPPVFLEYTPSADPERARAMQDLLFGAYGQVCLYDGAFRPLSKNGFAALSRQVDLLAI